MKRSLDTRRGRIEFPTFFPVTTFGGRFPLDEIVRPYLGRLAQGVMVSHYYAQKMKEYDGPPLFIDSGGFASLFAGSQIIEQGEIACICTKEGSRISPEEVLRFQEDKADIGATVDFIVPPDMKAEEGRRRQDLTIRNAVWAIDNKTRADLRLYASVQAWDRESALYIMKGLKDYPFDGFALGGMVPRLKKPKVVFEVVQAIRDVEKERPLHVFGVGQPSLVKALIDYGVDSVDSSSYVRYSIDRKYFDEQSGKYLGLSAVPTKSTCSCTVCESFTKDYLAQSGECNALAIALHNLVSQSRYMIR